MYCKRFIASGIFSVAKDIRTVNISTASVTGNLVTVNEKNGNTLKFSRIWLRDNCQCNDCFHEHTRSRTANWKSFNLNRQIKNLQKTDKENGIIIEWDDKHKSVFNVDWLRKRNFSAENQKNYVEGVYKPTPKLWNKDRFSEVLKNFEFEKVLQDNNVLLSWLQALAIEGFSIVKNAPDDVNVVRQLADRIGYIKRTSYGEVFEVKSKENAHNYAYLMTPLPLHTDMPYYEYKAGINILHCLVQSQSKGGANLMTDGFNVAETLRLQYPKYFNILSSVPVDWYDRGIDGGASYYNIWRAPVICLDIDKNYQRINHNTTKRDSHFTVPLEQVDSWYEAYEKFQEIAYSEAIEFKTSPGDVFVFNNLRMLHGRTAYQDSIENRRHLIGAYVDWDVIYSKIRILKLQQNQN